MSTYTLTIGTTVNSTGPECMGLATRCYEQIGQRTSFVPGPAAEALRDFYKAIGHDLIWRALPDQSGEWRYWTGKYWAKYDPSLLEKDISYLLGERLHARTISLLVDTMKIRSVEPWDMFDTKPMLALDNCTMRLEGGRLTPDNSFRKEDYSTFKLDVPLQRMPTPKWTAMLNQMLPHEEDRKTLQELIGAVFFPAFRAQVIGAFVGIAGAGKSTVAAIVRNILGDVRTGAVQACELSRPHMTRDLLGKFVNFDSESEYIKPEDEVILKPVLSN